MPDRKRRIAIDAKPSPRLDRCRRRLRHPHTPVSFGNGISSLASPLPFRLVRARDRRATAAQGRRRDPAATASVRLARCTRGPRREPRHQGRLVRPRVAEHGGRGDGVARAALGAAQGARRRRHRHRDGTGLPLRLARDAARRRVAAPVDAAAQPAASAHELHRPRTGDREAQGTGRRESVGDVDRCRRGGQDTACARTGCAIARRISGRRLAGRARGVVGRAARAQGHRASARSARAPIQARHRGAQRLPCFEKSTARPGQRRAPAAGPGATGRRDRSPQSACRRAGDQPRTARNHRRADLPGAVVDGSRPERHAGAGRLAGLRRRAPVARSRETGAPSPWGHGSC